MHDALTRYLPETIVWCAVVAVQAQLARWLMEFIRSAALRALVWAAASLACLSILLSFALSLPKYAVLPGYLVWLRGLILAWGLASFGVFLVVLLWRRLPAFDPQRRGVVRTAGLAAVTAPFAVAGFGILIERKDFQLRQVDIAIPGLSKDLAGLKLLQLTDIHLSPFLSERDLARVVDIANETKPQLALITGDLTTSRGDPLDACLHQLARLKADAGIFGCLGNHEIYSGTEYYATRQGARLGIRFLRRQSGTLRFGSAVLNLAGVDYQMVEKPYLPGAQRLVLPSALNVLLSHNPNVLPVAAEQGYDIVLSGHTHGGQVAFEILDRNLSPARFHTPYVAGLYREGPTSLYVSRGVGTIGVPLRLGVPPEITLVTLCAT